MWYAGMISVVCMVVCILPTRAGEMGMLNEVIAKDKDKCANSSPCPGASPPFPTAGKTNETVCISN